VYLPRFEVPSGSIDGVNTTFVVSRAYVPGSTALFWNGLLMVGSFEDGWDEVDPVLGVVATRVPPMATGQSDVLQVFYLDASFGPGGEAEEVASLCGTLRAVDVLRPTLIETPVLQATVSSIGELEAVLKAVVGLTATVREKDQMRGILTGGLQ
jgi:hypothetical protein